MRPNDPLLMNDHTIRSLVSRAFLLLLLASTAAHSNALSELLDQVNEQRRLVVPLRADIDAKVDHLEGEKQERLVVIVRNHPSATSEIQTYVELDKAKLKFLLLGAAGSYGFSDGQVKSIPLDTPLGPTSWVVEDLLPFSASRCAVIRIADSTPEQTTVACEPKKDLRSTYSMFVYKFDREKFVPHQILYYRDTLSNLVKLQRNEDFELVGSRWRPRRVTMQDFKLHTRDEFEIHWTTNPEIAPDLFDSQSLGRPSTIHWPKTPTP